MIWIIFFLFIQCWVWPASLVLQRSLGTAAQNQAIHVRPLLRDAGRCIPKSVKLRRSPKNVFSKRNVSRKPTLLAWLPLKRWNVKCTVVIQTTVMLAQLSASAVFCYWHAPWHPRYSCEIVTLTSLAFWTSLAISLDRGSLEIVLFSARLYKSSLSTLMWCIFVLNCTLENKASRPHYRYQFCSNFPFPY